MDCGPTCLRMIAKYYGRQHNADGLREAAGFNKEGVSLLGISAAAEQLGFRTRGVQLDYFQLTTEAPLPCILHWDQKHYVVLVRVAKKSLFRKEDKIVVADPANGILTYKRSEFLNYWPGGQAEWDEKLGIALLLEPTPKFYESGNDKEGKLSWRLVVQYLQNSGWQITQVFVALLVTSLLQLIFPFLTQSIVDTGINTQNLRFITVVLVAQLMLIFSKTIVDFIRIRLLLRISTIVNLSILSDFWIKLTRLPISFFDSRMTGDTLQRINDNRLVQNFLTGSALNTAFSFLNFIIYIVLLAFYNLKLLVVFSIGSALYVLWVRVFLGMRRKLNYQTFNISARENSATLQLVQGMQEIRLNNAEQLKRWEWENLQAGIFKLNFKSLSYSQLQQTGAMLINQGKDVVITFLVAGLVIEGRLTLGAMLAIQYVVGQLSGPIEQFVGFTQSAQDAKISIERLNEIHQLQDEEQAGAAYIHQIPENKRIQLEDLSFTYPGVGKEPVLKNITLEIPQGKVTAIVGVSGSGKTTLLKLLLKFYEDYAGKIKIGDTNFSYISPSFWRQRCAAVMQEGYIFSDSIARNIAVGQETIDYERMVRCCKAANILSFVESLPNGFITQIGAEGVGLSQGQKQRILIARSIYKDPDYLLFDEATNALDANNEKEIVENLQDFFRGRTVVIVAHRLSTVRHADKIIVLHEGKIAEEGTHQELSDAKGKYFELVKNQLELGN